VPEKSAVEGILRALVEAMEAREAAEPDLPEWEANARLRAAEVDLLKLYRESGRSSVPMVPIEILDESDSFDHIAVEVA
jgi:hypothetical protein